ncbi:MAG: AMP-binding protein, partial [Alphaproteobacteria bacterium]|nr:AMP-binding protein [Alphaproteobacteria bacterium]
MSAEGSVADPCRFENVADLVTFWAEAAPDKVAIVDGKRSWTFQALACTIATTARWLSENGVRAGDRVLLVCENSAAATAIFFACNAIKAWCVPVNARLSDREIEEVQSHAGARAVIFTALAGPRAAAWRERPGWSAHQPADFGEVLLSPLNVLCRPEPPAADPGEDIAALIYTTGTTGKPKGVMLSHANLLFVARASAAARRLTQADRVYALLPISHILGLTGVLLGAMASGAEVHLVPRFAPQLLLSALAKDAISVVIGTPSMYALVAEYAGRKGLAALDAPALRLISSAGAPLDAATKAKAEALFGQTLHNGYGITECSPTITLTRLDQPRADCSVGSLLPGIEAKLIDGAGNAVSGDTGELAVRGPGVMKGYYRSPEETAAAVDREGWFRTGDLARIESGNLFIVGRAKEMIVRFGFNVYPAEV